MTSEKYTIGFIFFMMLAYGCDPEKKEDSQCTPYGAPRDTGDLDPDYGLINLNWVCDDNPIDTPFEVEIEAFQRQLSTIFSATRATAETEFDDDVMDPTELLWEGASSAIEITHSFIAAVDADADGTEPVKDGNSVVTILDGKSGDFDFPDVSTSIGTLAQIVYDDPNSDGQLRSCDIVFFSERELLDGSIITTNWGLSPGVGVSHVINNTFTHEVGHCLGLGHPEEGTLTDSIMSYGRDRSLDATLSSDDEDAVVYLYGP